MMRKQELVHYRKALSSQLLGLLGQGEEAIRQMAGEEAEDLPDPNDRATLETDRSHLLRLRDRDRKLVGKIEDALRRIEAGTFGVCESCGSDISAARLKARPMTTLCIDCKTESERLER
jgi:DnaK suppressor protein